MEGKPGSITDISGQRTGDTGRFLPVRGLRWGVAVAMALVPLAQVGAILWLIWQRTQDVPNADEWGLVPTIAKFHRGQLPIADFWAPNNGHRIVFMRLLDLIIIELTHWNRQVMMTVDVAIAVGTALLLLASARRTLPSIRATTIVLVPFALLLFSLGQFENWMLVYTNNFFTTVFAVALCAWALATKPPSWHALALVIIGAFLATLSSFAGLAVWVVFLPVLWFVGYRKRAYFAVWSAAALAIAVPYLAGFPGTTATASPSDTLRYMLAYLGAPLSQWDVWRAQIAAIASIVLLIANLFVYRLLRRDLRPVAPWFGVAAFALGCAAMAAVGRGATLGVAQALQSRYRAFSSLWWIALIVIACAVMVGCMEMLRAQTERRLAIATMSIGGVNIVSLLIMCIALVQVNASGFTYGRTFLDGPREQQSCILNYALASDRCLQSYLPFADGAAAVRSSASLLERMHMGIFFSGHPLRVSDLTKTARPMLYAVESVGGMRTSLACMETAGCNTLPNPPRIVLPVGIPLDVTGWAVDANAGTPAGAVLVAVDGRVDVLAEHTVGDYSAVAEVFNRPSYRTAGFAASVPTSALSEGIHMVTLLFVTHDGVSYSAMPQAITVDIRPWRDVTRRADATLYAVEGVSGLERPIVDPSRPVVFSGYAFLSLSGWAIDRAAGAPARTVYLSIDDRQMLPAEYGDDRPDVAALLGDAAYRRSAFRATIPINVLPVGSHRLRLGILAADGISYYEPPWYLDIVVRA